MSITSTEIEKKKQMKIHISKKFNVRITKINQ